MLLWKYHFSKNKFLMRFDSEIYNSFQQKAENNYLQKYDRTSFFFQNNFSAKNCL